MPGVTISKMKEGYSQIRSKALASAFSYLKLIERWGTGMPRLLEEMNSYGLREPEIIDWGDALCINLYRRAVPDSSRYVPDNSESTMKAPGNTKSLPDSHRFF